MKHNILTAAILAALSGQAWACESVNINTAGAGELATALDGIGEKKSQAIVKYRDENGLFADAQALDDVSGIGKKTLAKNKDCIVTEQ